MIAERIFHWASQTPYNTAIIHNGRHWSYRSFARLIAKARGHFVRRGFAGPGYAVLAVRNMKDFWVLSLALRSLGLTTLAARSVPQLHRLDLPDVRLVVTIAAEAWPGLEGVCQAHGLPLLAVSLDGEVGIPLDAPEARHPAGGHVVWTSGTTGADKMVLLSAEIDAFYLPLKVQAANIRQDTMLCMFGISGATAAGARWAPSPWMAGGATLFEQERERYQALLRPGITHAFLNPAMLASILAVPQDAFPRNDALQLFVGGGPMTLAQVEQAKARVTPRVFNLLAATEAGVIAVTPLDTPEDHRWHRLVPSRAVDVVDESGRPTPLGETGLMRIATAGGPTGYLNDEAATKAFFKDGCFYSGDLAILRADGRIALQGRVTDVINLQGKKVSPAHIEDRLADTLGLNSVCLFSTQNDKGEEELHVVLETPAPVEPQPVGDVLKMEIPGFNKAIVHFVAAMPRNEMGKLVRRDVRAQSRAIPGHMVQW